MKKRQLVQTYGRHRQRVVSVDVWSSPANSVFSSSNDSFLSQSGTISTSDSSHSSRCLKDKKENRVNISWLPEDENVKRNSRRTRKTVDYSYHVSEKEEKQNQKTKKTRRPVLKEKTNINKNELAHSVIDETNTRPSRKIRNTTTEKQKKSELSDDAKGVNKHPASVRQRGSSKKELSHNFSDFDEYDLVFDSPKNQRIISPELSVQDCELPDVKIITRSGTLTSTPHHNQVVSHERPQQRTRSTLTSTPHTFSNGKLCRGISTRSHRHVTPHRPDIVSGQHCSFSGLDAQNGTNVHECIENMDHLHLSGMSSIAASPSISASATATATDAPVISATPTAVSHSNEQIALIKQCSVSLQKLKPTNASSMFQGLHSMTPNPRSTVTRTMRSSSKKYPLSCNNPSRQTAEDLRYSLLHSCMDHSETDTSKGRHRTDNFYSCSSAHEPCARLNTSKLRNSTYTVDTGGSFSQDFHDPSEDLFDSVAHSMSGFHCHSKVCDGTTKGTQSGLSSIQEVSQRLQQMCMQKEAETDSVIDESPEEKADSLYTVTSDEELSDIIEEEEGQGPDREVGESLYTLASDEELSVIDEDEEKQVDWSENESEKENHASESEESESEESETSDSGESPDTEEKKTPVVPWSDEDSVYLTANQSDQTTNSTAPEKVWPSHSMNNNESIGNRNKTQQSSILSSYNTPKRTLENSSHRLNQLHECCVSLKALTPVRCKKSGQTLSAREKVLFKCNQTEPNSFTEAITPSMLKKCVKIGEGVYGEVFKTERNKQSVALKIIPIEGDFEVNDEPQKTFEEMLPEIVISKELCALKNTEDNMTSNFVEVKGVSVVQGSYHPQLLKQWDIFHKKKGSENDRPDMFDEEQLFIVFEFEECGCDLEAFKFGSLEEAKSVLLQVSCSLGVAETALQFEHRDLHWGNVLVKRTREETLSYILAGESFDVETCGIKVSIIDFTLSRLSKDGCEVFCDLSTDPTLFTGQGDYQFDVYREMKAENGNEWRPFHAYTNVLWIHYLADKLLKSKSYSEVTSREHSLLSRQFRNFLRDALDYQSALHLIKDSCFFNEP